MLILEDTIDSSILIEDEFILQLPPCSAHKKLKDCDSVILENINVFRNKQVGNRPFNRFKDDLTKDKEILMAVQKSKKTRSRRDMRRSHDRLSSAALSIEPETGSIHRRHHISEDGFYRGREIIPPKPIEDEDEEGDEV